MKMKSSVGIGVGISLVAVALSGALPASAAASKSGVSNVVKLSTGNVPCDGVAYPVAESWNQYTEVLRTPNVLAKGALQKLTYASEVWTLDSVSDAYTRETSFGLEAFTAPVAGGVIPAGKGVFGLKSSTTTTYTHSTTAVPKEINEIDVTATVDGIKATPTAFKLQGWGQYYKCEVGTRKLIQVGGLNTVTFDVTQATGWVLERSDGKPLGEGDLA